MRRMVGVLVAVVLVAVHSTPANATTYEVNQKTLSSFSSESKTLSSTQKTQIRAAVDSNPDAEKFICTGIRYFSQPQSVNILVRARAKAACEYAKQLNPNLSTWYQTKPTQARSYAGKVLLTIKTALVPPTFESYQSSRISSQAFTSVQSVLNSSTESISDFEIIAGPSVTPAQLKLETARIQASLKFWRPNYSERFTAYLYTGKDVDWVIEKLEARGNSFWNGLIRNSYWQQTGKCAQSATAVIAGNNHLIHCVESDYESVRFSNIFAHEVAHLPLMRNSANQPASIFSNLPVWLNEGGAQFFSIALTNEADDPNSAYWHDVHVNAPREKIKLSNRASSLTLAELLPTITAAETVELFEMFEPQGEANVGIPYSIGTWATEVLVAIGGAEKFQQYLASFSPTSDWKMSFEKTYGITVTQFYAAMAPYLRWVSDEYKR